MADLPIRVTGIEVVGFTPTESSLVFVNGIAVPSSDYVIDGIKVLFKYLLSENDRVTVVK